MTQLFVVNVVVAVQVIIVFALLAQEPKVVQCQQATTKLSTQICTACSSIGRRLHHLSSADYFRNDDVSSRRVSSHRNENIFPLISQTTTSSSLYQQQQQEDDERNLVETTTLSTDKYPNVTITNYGPNITNTSYLDGGNSCVDNCTAGVEFCGNDGTCHSTSCENFYYYGSSFYTGVPTTASTSNQSTTTTTATTDITDIAPINCTAIDVFAQSIHEFYPVAIVYGCADEVGTSTKEPKPICLPQNKSTTSYSVYYNQKCVAYPAPHHTFTCYSMKPNTNFTSYKLQTLPSSNVGETSGYQCSASTSSTASIKSSILPQHMYGIDIVRVDMTPSSSYGCSKVATIMQSSNLIEDLAYSALSSVLAIENPNNSNNNSSTKPSPSPVQSASVASSLSRSILTGIAIMMPILGFVLV